MLIESPHDTKLDDLRDELASLADDLDQSGMWPQRQLQRCAEYGVYRWFLPQHAGGTEWSEADIAAGYQKLASGCLTTTFVITQYMGAAKRIANSDNELLKTFLVPQLLAGQLFATVGISHLTTSRRHLAKPVLQATETEGGFYLNGMSPWVTGSTKADIVVLGATLDDGRQLLASVPTEADTISRPQPQGLVALNSSVTGPVKLQDHFVPTSQLIAGPLENVMAAGVGARTGGVQTSTLAAGLAEAAIQFLTDESQRRSDLSPATTALSGELSILSQDIQDIANGKETSTKESLRTRANSLALRSTQAALAAAKGTGFMSGHPTGRWCREALFFLVWSCPQPVLEANLCELAGLTSS